ncbi:MAG: SUMF1/EgtB/PvdO family nonheme iron enzyme [Beijerinckiaceae bacterium]
MVRRFVTFAFVFLAVATVATMAARPAQAEKRVALVIGNGAYRTVARLPNPANDAVAIGDLFRSAGFDDVRTVTNVGVADMRKELRAFSEKAAGADIAVVFYAGHGMEIGGHNYLIPTDAVLARDLDVEDEAVDLDRVLQLLEPAKRLKLVILDACRENPFAAKIKRTIASRAVGRGLGQPDLQTSDTLVAYAARAGSLAGDGEGDHSPFTTALLHHIATPGLDLRIALGDVHDEVLKTSNREQEPFIYGALGGGTLALVPGKAEPLPADPESAARADYALAEKIGTVSGWDAFLAHHAIGILADLAKAERQKLAEGHPVQSESKPEGGGFWSWLKGKPAADTPTAEPQQKIAAALPVPPPPVVTGPCGGAVLASLGSRAAAPLSAREECALKPKDEFKECANCPPMVVVPPGSFTMGSPASEPGRFDNEGPQHVVSFAKPFAVGKFQVTRDEFAAFVNETGYDSGSPCWTFAEGRSNRSWRNPGFAQTGSHPATCLSWNDAQAYAAWLATKTGKTYRLLSEAEWEYVARGQTQPGKYPRYFFGDDEKDMCRYGNGADQTAKEKVPGAQGWTVVPCNDGYAYTSPVGSFQPNAFGLYDMAGNVLQWVEDCSADTYQGAPTNGSAMTTGDCSRRVLRGGSWIINPQFLRAAGRIGNSPDHRSNDVGFRLARTLNP